MANTNSIFPYSKARLDEVQESIGVTQFPGETTWYQVLGGLVIQGGFEVFTAPATRTVNFVAPFDKQLLGVFISPASAANGPHGHIVALPTLTSFQINHHGANASYYWWAVGV